MSSAQSGKEAWQTLAELAPDLDPDATLTAARYAATVRAEAPEWRDSATLPSTVGAVTLPELPLLAVDRLRDGDPASARPSGVDADFEVTGVLGEGGMGRILLARQRSLRRDVAIKVMKDDHAGEEGVDNLLAEAVITGSVEHPGVIPVHALGRDTHGHPILVMKRIEGVSWRELVEHPGHDLWSLIAPDAGDQLDAHLEILMAVCSAAHCAHVRGFVHRDIKLDNVMIGSYGEVYLVDWGISMRLPKAGEPARGPRGLVGTPAYLAPEMVLADLAGIDARTDVYLLGATLHAVLTGAPRHRGETLADVLASALDAALFPYGPEVPAELAVICNRAMAASPGDRFASALELRHALASFRRHRSSIEIGDEAAAQLAAVPRADAARAHALLTECRFGFMAALRAWPENPGARAGLERCLLRMIDHEILQRDPGGARALLAQLEGEHPDLARRVEALEAELGAAAEREAQLARLEHHRDLSIGSGAQLALVAILLALAAGALVYMGRGDRPVVPAVIVGLPAVFFAVLLVALVLSRRRLRTEISRKAMAMLLLSLGAVIVHRALLVALGTPIPDMFAGDLVLGATVEAAAAITLVPRLGWVVPVNLVGAIGLALRPDLTVPIFSTVVVVGLAALMLVWRQAAQKRPE